MEFSSVQKRFNIRLRGLDLGYKESMLHHIHQMQDLVNLSER